MNSPAQSVVSNGAASARDLFALTDEQILQIEPDAQDAGMFAGERTDTHDPLREDLDLLGPSSAPESADDHRQQSRGGRDTDDGLKAVATNGNAAARNASVTNTSTNAPSTTSAANPTSNGEAPAWLVERMNDPQNGAEARALWDGLLAARQEVSAFREVFAKPEEARTVAERARTLDDFDRAYFGVSGQGPEQLSASRAELAGKMLYQDPVAFREMVFAGLRAIESAAQQGNSASSESAGSSVAPPFRAASSEASATHVETPNVSTAARQPSLAAQQDTPSRQHAPQQHTQVQDAHVVAYAAFEQAVNAELERGVGGAIDRSLQAALPNAARSENGAALKGRLGAAIRQDVEKALQGDRALGEQVARVLSGQRLDDATRAQVVRLIGDRAQQLVPGSARRVLADWTQTTLASHAGHSNARQSVGGANVSTSIATQKKTLQAAERGAPAQRTSRKIDYRHVSDDDILAF